MHQHLTLRNGDAQIIRYFTLYHSENKDKITYQYHKINCERLNQKNRKVFFYFEVIGVFVTKLLNGGKLGSNF